MITYQVTSMVIGVTLAAIILFLVRRDQLVEPFAKALAALEVGQLSDAVETQFGFHLIQKLDYQPARQQSFEEIQSVLEQNLRLTYVRDQLDQKALEYPPGPDAQFDELAAGIR